MSSKGYVPKRTHPTQGATYFTLLYWLYWLYWLYLLYLLYLLY